MLQPAASAAADTLVTVITDSLSVATAAAAQPEPVKELSVWDLCMEGGFIMIPLLILALISIYIFIERAIVLRRAARDDAHFMSRIKDYIHHGDPEAALRLCNHTNSPYARLIAKGITRIGRPMNDVLVAIENTGNLEIASLGKGLPWLATTAAGAPMLGFLGTVMGECRLERQHRRARRRHLRGSRHHRGRSDCGHRGAVCLQLSGGTHQRRDDLP